jgi:pyruvate/2-oxoglutarate dehydrogenase complex dihydrolipoamide dehydrogenase (E3) component
MAKRGEDFGVLIGGDIAVDIKRVKARKDAIVKKSNDGVTGWMKVMDNLTVFEGHGRLESANSVSVNGQILKADKIILKVG